MGHTIDPRYRAGQTPPDQVEGEIPLAIRKDTSGATVSDGEYTALQVDADGRLKVAASVAGGGTEYNVGDSATGFESGPYILVEASDGTYQALKVDASTRSLYVDVQNDVTVVDGGGSLTVDGTVTANAGTGPFPISDNGGSITVDGTVTANAGTGPFPISDNGGSITVDGTVTADGGSGTFHVVTSGNTLGIDDDGGSITVDDGSGSITVDDGGVPLEVIERGTTIASGSVSVTGTAGVVLSADSTRRSVVLTNLGTDYVWVGTSGVTTNTGIRLSGGQAVTIDRAPTAAIYAVASSGTQTVAYFTEAD